MHRVRRVSLPSVDDGARLSAHAEVEISESNKEVDSWRVLAKNARLNSDERLVQLDLELSMLKWDMVCCSETRTKTQDVFVKNGHRLICSNDTEAKNPASGVVILVHSRWTTSIKSKICFHN